MRDLAKLINKTLTLTDSRTGITYSVSVHDVKESYGKLRVQVVEDGHWFEPSDEELEAVK